MECLRPVEWEGEPQPRAVRLVSGSARVDDPVRVTVAGVEVEGRIGPIESSTLRLRVGPPVLVTLGRLVSEFRLRSACNSHGPLELQD